MPKQADRLMLENISKNHIDQGEHPSRSFTRVPQRPQRHRNCHYRLIGIRTSFVGAALAITSQSRRLSYSTSGFIAPFASPNLKYGFRNPRVSPSTPLGTSSASRASVLAGSSGARSSSCPRTSSSSCTTLAAPPACPPFSELPFLLSTSRVVRPIRLAHVPALRSPWSGLPMILAVEYLAYSTGHTLEHAGDAGPRQRGEIGRVRGVTRSQGR
ncbi:uncharacterized protein B0H18DRAFT_1213932 [Fomitopsis serialis]|uniref:uncharacterized protein n=1 Tax=Fomitopsis serialis TaxID=139415 RepID=UPI002008D8C8|nr:uncharacterized protein B0H18DRAFT_1213932 [Neoantrodia serialis]KAH9919263.1 hypothetical protein B0H18DRAFT_1213932 [Neoantrodia serialis]